MRALYGLYRGVVTTSDDPEGLGRLRAQVPQILGHLEIDWAWPAMPNIAGMVPLQPGDPVWISFEDGQVEKPVWLGTWQRNGQELANLPGLVGDIADLNADLAAEIAARIAADALKMDKTKLYAVRSYARATFR